MNITCSELDNIEIAIEYFFLIKQVGDELIKYLRGYRQISQEYNKKLQILINSYGKKLIKPNENSKNSHILEITQKAADVIVKNIQLFNFSIKEIDIKIQEMETMLKEKSEKINILKKTYLDLPKNLISSFNEINKTKNSYLNSISRTEEIIDKYYIDKFKIQNHENGLGIKLNENEYKIMKGQIKSQLNDMNTSIKLSKKYEDFHKGSITAGIKVQNKFLQDYNNYIKEIKKNTCDISNGIKNLVSSFMLLYKNLYKQPLLFIDENINKFNTIDEEKEMDNIMNSNFKKDNNLNISPTKYQLKSFSYLKESNYLKNQEDNNNIINNTEILKDKILNKSKRKVIENLEDGFGIMSYICDDSLMMTIKSLFDNFDYIEKENFDIKFEVGKNKTQNYILKIIANMNNFPYAKDGFYTNNKLKNKKDYKIKYKRDELTKEEIIDLRELLDIHENRVILLQKLSDYRGNGKFVLCDPDYFLLSELFNIISDKIKRDSDYRVAELVIVISETYFMEEKERKKYLQESIKNHKVYKDKNFWEEFLCYSINKEIMKTLKNDQKIQEDKAISDYKFSNVVFTQILTLIDNMFEFNVDSNTVKEVLNPKIRIYKLSDEFKETINNIIESKKNPNEIIEKTDIEIKK